MANTILHKRSTVSGKMPTAEQLAEGELALNLADERVFIKNSSGNIVEVSYRDTRARAAISAASSGAGSVSYNAATGVISYTGPSSTEIRSQISAGSGISYDQSTGEISTGGEGSFSSVTVSGDVSAATVTLAQDPTSALQAATKQYVDDAVAAISQVDELSVTNDADIGGNLTVAGTVTAPTFKGDLTGTVSSLSNHDTGDLAEGTNLYYTDARARAALSAGGSLSYDNTTGVISYTAPTTITGNAATATKLETARAISGVDFDGTADITLTTTGVTEGTNLYYTDARARAAIAAGTGVSVTDGEISIGQAVATTDNVTFNNVVVGGNLTVSGTTTTVNSTTVNISDSVITLNSGETGAPSQDAGIEIERGTADNVSLLWDETNDRWTVGSQSFVAAAFIGNLTGNVTGNVSGSAGSTSGNAATATKWETARTITVDGGVTGSVELDGSADVTLSLTIGADYMVNVVGDNGVSISHEKSAGSEATISLDGSYTGTWAVTGSVTATGEITAYFSDEKLKTNIVEIADALAKVEAIRGIEFDPNQTALDLGVSDQRQMGVIAQEVEAVAPLLVTESAFEGYKTVRYDKLTVLLIQAVKELSAKVTSLEQALASRQ